MRGGARPGAGAKPKAVTEKTTEVCKAAITGKYGSLEEGIKKLLESGEPSLVKFVFEHAFGKPTERVEQSGGLSITAFWDKTLIPSDTPAPPQE